MYDYFNGIEDLKHRRIRFVGDPGERIREDYLRILRYFRSVSISVGSVRSMILINRFFGRLAHDNAEHDPQTLDAIYQNSHGLKGSTLNLLIIDLSLIVFVDISGERLWVELKRIAEGRNAGPVLKTMLEQNIGQYLGNTRFVRFRSTVVDLRSRNSIESGSSCSRRALASMSSVQSPCVDRFDETLSRYGRSSSIDRSEKYVETIVYFSTINSRNG